MEGELEAHAGMSALYYIVLAAISLHSAAELEQDGGTRSIPAPAPVPASAPAPDQNADSVTLKSGRVLQGVKVVQSTPFKLFLEIIPSVEPLEIPVKQVTSVAHGRPEAPRSEVPVAPPVDTEEEASTVLQAVKISPDLAKKMAAPLTDKAIEFNDQDLLNTLRSVGILSGVPVTFGPKLEKLPREERTISLRLAGGMSFDRFIRDTLAPSVPWLEIEYHFDAMYFELR